MNVPKLRFKEFTDEWSYQSLSKYVNRITTKNKNNESNLVLTISAQYGLVDQTNFFNRSVSSSNLTGYYLLNNGDFAYNKSYSNGYPWGAVKRLNKYNQGVVSSLYICFKPNNLINSDFLEQYFETNKWYQQISEVSVEGARNHGLLNIAVNDFFNTKHYMPSIKEQEKISNFLSLLDKKIELQTKKIEDLKLFKKGLHDKLFNDVTGNDYLLSDIAVFENGKGHENIVDENGKYILINSKFISTEGNVTKKCSEQLTPLFKNDITMVMSDLPNGKALAKCYYIDENNKYSLNQRICKIKVKDDSIINSKYLFYLLNRNSYYLRFDDGVNQTNLKKDDILSLNLVLPSIKDQERDSKTLTIIDNIIEKENNKLSKLNLLKKGLMQSMFV